MEQVFVSSAKSAISPAFQHESRSLIWIINNSGTKIDPWGTPQFLGSQEEAPFKDSIFDNKILWSIVSKALLRAILCQKPKNLLSRFYWFTFLLDKLKWQWYFAFCEKQTACLWTYWNSERNSIIYWTSIFQKFCSKLLRQISVYNCFNRFYHLYEELKFVLF